MADEPQTPNDPPVLDTSPSSRSAIGPIGVVVIAGLLFVYGPRVLDIFKTAQYRDEIKRVCGYIPGGDIMRNAHEQCANCVKSGGQWERLDGGSAADLLRAGHCRPVTRTETQ